MTSPVVANGIYVILGASGNTGSIIANDFLLNGKKVRVVGRDAGATTALCGQRRGSVHGRIERCGCAQQSLQRCTRGILDAAAGKIPRGPGAREQCDREGREGVWPSLRGAFEQLRRAGSGRHRASRGTAFFGAKTQRDQQFERSAPARRVFHGEQSGGDRHDSWDGDLGNALLPDLKLPMVATRDVGDYAAQRLLHLDFSGKQTRELLGERDLSMTEATAVIARGIGKPDLRYKQFPYDQVQQALTQMGIPPKGAAMYIEMYKAINAGVLVPLEPRSPENTTPTSFEKFVQDVFAAAYQQNKGH